MGGSWTLFFSFHMNLRHWYGLTRIIGKYPRFSPIEIFPKSFSTVEFNNLHKRLMNYRRLYYSDSQIPAALTNQNSNLNSVCSADTLFLINKATFSIQMQLSMLPLGKQPPLKAEVNLALVSQTFLLTNFKIWVVLCQIHVSHIFIRFCSCLW